MEEKIALIVSDQIDTTEETTSLYQIYKVDKTHTFDNLIAQAKKDGFKEILAFACEEFELCGVKSKKKLGTFVTKCNGKAAEFYIHQAKLMIQAKLSFEEVITSLSMGLRNSAYAMMREYQSYVK